jgi:hypothetical protein
MSTSYHCLIQRTNEGWRARGVGVHEDPATSRQHVACSHAPMFGKPACCNGRNPLRPLAATPSAIMPESVPPLWSIRMACQRVCQS